MARDVDGMQDFDRVLAIDYHDDYQNEGAPPPMTPPPGKVPKRDGTFRALIEILLMLGIFFIGVLIGWCSR